MNLRRKLVLFSLCLVIFQTIGFTEEIYSSGDDIYRNVLEVNPTSDSFYVAYERVLYYSEEAFFQIDARNTIKSDDDFGRAGMTWRYSLNPDNVLSSRVETAWIDGQNNLTLKLGYDNPTFGFAVTGVQSLSDPEITRTEVTVTSSDSSSVDTMTGESGGYENYERLTTTTNQVIVSESRFATPDGVLFDINFNLFGNFTLTTGGSYWEVDDWDETGYHANLNWQITEGDAIGAHGAKVGDESEGGIYYRKSFSSFGDIFKPGRPLKGGAATSMPLIQRLASTPYATPQMKVMTATDYVETREEVQVVEEVTQYQVEIEEENEPPVVTVFDVAGQPGQIEVFDLQGTDSDGTIETWVIYSSLDGRIGSGNWPMVGIATLPASFGNHTVSVEITDDDGDSTTYTYPAVVQIM